MDSNSQRSSLDKIQPITPPPFLGLFGKKRAYYYDLKCLATPPPSSKSLWDIYDQRTASLILGIENVVVPLYKCIDLIQQKNKRVNRNQNLFPLPTTLNSYLKDSYLQSGRLLGNRIGGLLPANVDSPENIEMEVKLKIQEDAVFDAYCKLRQFMDVADAILSPKEKEFLQTIVNRKEGDYLQERYENQLRPQTSTDEEDDIEATLVLPKEFFSDDSFFDPQAAVIGVLSKTIIKSGGQCFANMIECLASKEFGYISPSIGNKRLLAARLSGRKLPTSFKTIQWIDKTSRSVSETEKIMLWITHFMYGGGYDRAYAILNLERNIKVGQESANLKNADKVFRNRIEQLYRLT